MEIINSLDIKTIMSKVDDNSILISEVVDTIVYKYCKPLDKYINQINDVLKSDTDIADAELDEIVMNIPCLIYFASEAMENLGIKEDVSKAIRDEIFTKVRDNAEGTIADKNNTANIACYKETIILSIYQRAYKKIKARIDCAYELLNSVKKVISHRQSQFNISKSDSN